MPLFCYSGIVLTLYREKTMELLHVLMQNEDLTETEALELIKGMRQQVLDGENPEDILYDIGLEPDYVLDILPY